MQNRHQVRIRFIVQRTGAVCDGPKLNEAFFFPPGLCRNCIARIGGSVTVRRDLRFA
jgi:hypothetical protein